MGVEYKSCSGCKESLYEEYVDSCIECGTSLCTSCLINTENSGISNDKAQYAYQYGYRFDPDNITLMKKYESDGFELYDNDGKSWYDKGDILDDSCIDEKYCPCCSGDEINKEDLFDFLISKYKLDIRKEWDEFKNKGK